MGRHGKILISFFMIIFTCAHATANPLQKQVPQRQDQIQFSFAPLVKHVIPAVVNIYAARQINVRTPFEDDPFFEQFFGRLLDNQPSRTQSSLGSGVIVDKNGLIITNYHVIKGADEIKVALADGREFDSKILLKDEGTDTAILKIEPRGAEFPVLRLGNSDNVEVGDLVLAVGNPFGVGQTVTSGIVSAQARTRVGISDFDFYIQTDAAINPGNSGGALVDMAGELIGINTAIYSRSGGSVGIGFAIPANLVRAVVAAAKNGDKTFEPPFLGASFQTVTSDVAESLGLDHPYGALVTDVVSNGPAGKSGLKVGDVVTRLDGKIIDNPDSLGYRLVTAGIGHKVRVEYIRDGKVETTTFDLIAQPKDDGRKAFFRGNTPFSGAYVSELTALNSQRYHLPSKARGIIISAVETGTNAAGLFKAGDLILAVNGKNILSIDDLKAILHEGTPRAWQLKYQRDGVLIQQIVR